MEMTMETLLRAKQVAEILNIRVSTVYALAHRGAIPYVRVAKGSRRPLIRFRASDLEKLLTTHTIPPSEECPNQ